MTRSVHHLLYCIIVFTRDVQYKGGMFKVPMLERWLVVVTGPKLMDELQRFPDEYVSFTAANAEVDSSQMYCIFSLTVYNS